MASAGTAPQCRRATPCEHGDSRLTVPNLSNNVISFGLSIHAHIFSLVQQRVTGGEVRPFRMMAMFALLMAVLMAPIPARDPAGAAGR
jgi:hypothetical protein